MPKVALWVVDNEYYDFSEFKYKHPGGRLWFDRNVNRDLTAMFHTYHKDPAKLVQVLAKYRVNKENVPNDFKVYWPVFDPDFVPEELPRFKYDETPDLFLSKAR